MKKQKEKTDPKTIEIPLHFHNYKLLKDKKFLLKGSAIYFVRGPNKVGKTTFLNALAAMQLASDTTPEPVTRGTHDGFNEFVIPGADGKMYTIHHTFDNKVNKFVAIDPDGKKISKVAEIREIFNYTHFTVDEFFSWSNSAPGRRKQRDIILQLLPVELQDKYQYLDDRETLLYEQRTTLAKDKDYFSKQLPLTKLSAEEEKTIAIKSNKDITKLQSDLLFATQLNERLNNLEEKEVRIQDTIIELQRQLAILQSDHIAVKAELTEKREALIKTIGSRTIEEFTAEVHKEEGNQKNLTELKFKHKTWSDLVAKHDTAKNEWDKVDVEIKDIRVQKDQIITDSDLPLKNLSFTDGYLTVDDFQFNENQICESDAVILVAKIMSKINPAPIQLIGDASILDLSRLEELNKIAEEEGKIMFVDEVSRDINDLQVVGYEEIKNKIVDKKADIQEETEVLDEEDKEILATFNDDEESNTDLEEHIKGSDPYTGKIESPKNNLLF